MTVLSLLIAGASGSAYAGEYQITDLGTLGGPSDHNGSSYAYGINSQGQVVGWSTNNFSPPYAFLYSNGVMKDLGALPYTSGSGAYGINTAGQVVGASSGIAFLYSGNTMTQLLPGGESSNALGINAVNSVAHAYLYGGGTVTDLNSQLGGGSSSANGINGSGQVIGQISTPGSSSGAAYLWTPTTPQGTTGTMLNLGSILVSSQSTALGINGQGSVVGSFVNSQGQTNAFLYANQ